MARKRRADLLKPVRWLTIAQIAPLWAKELKIPASIVQSELQLAVINLRRLERGEGLISEYPSELPPTNKPVDREWLEKFCEKQGPWPFPRFWSSGWETPTSYPGRPSNMKAIKRHLKILLDAYRYEDSLAEQARVLHAWAQAGGIPPRGAQIPTAHSIENGIRDEWHASAEQRERNRPRRDATRAA